MTGFNPQQLDQKPRQIAEWCKNTFEVARLRRINTDNSHHRYMLSRQPGFVFNSNRSVMIL